MGDLARVLDTIGISRRDDFRDAARAVIVRRREDLATFYRAFALFFNIRGKPLIWLSLLVSDSESLPQDLQPAQPFVDDSMPVNNMASPEMLVAKLSMIDTARSLRRQQPRVDIPMGDDAAEFRLMELPQMGTSDYVRRTMTLRAVNGAPIFQYEENPDDMQP